MGMQTGGKLTVALLMTSAAVIGILAPTGANAQGAPAAAPGGDNAVQEIVVTGTRIQQPNLQSVSPVQVVTSQDIAVGGRTQTVDILSQLPQVNFSVGADFGPTSDALSNPGGANTVDLRGLGPQRTLVLVDGKRLGIGDPNTGNTNPAPDINQIPSQLVDRIDVLTGGASATYGSDAVAGVVNFIMKKNFEGAQLDAQWGGYQHGQQNGFMQGLERSFGTPVPGSKWDGYFNRQRISYAHCRVDVHHRFDGTLHVYLAGAHLAAAALVRVADPDNYRLDDIRIGHPAAEPPAPRAKAPQPPPRDTPWEPARSHPWRRYPQTGASATITEPLAGQSH